MGVMNQMYYYIFDLPEEIIMDILSRLPVKSILRCRLVCKTWRSLVYKPLFAHMHLLRCRIDDDDQCKVNVFLMFTLRKRGHLFYFTLDDENCETSYEETLKRLEFTRDHLDSNYNIVGSCNGLICISDDSKVESLYICNPITRECLYLPSLFNQSSGTRTLNIIYGFGHLPSTNEYKVVRISYWRGDKHFEERVQVYTLGSGTGWREKARINHGFHFLRTFTAILANGALHWLDDDGKVVAFDLADEEFLVLPPSPPFFLDNDPELYYKLQVLGGHLCAVHFKNKVSVDVWSLQMNKKLKNGNYDMKGQNKYQFWTWIKEFNIDSDMEDQDPTPITMTKHGQVLFYSHGTLSHYDLKTANLEKLVEVKKYTSTWLFFQAIPHSNSFVSLKALGEEETETI